MGAIKRGRIIAALMALVMVMTSAAMVFASEESSTQGSSNANATVGNVEKGTLKVTAQGAVQYSVNNGKTWKTLNGTKIKKLKKGQLVIVKTDQGTSYRWMQTVKITKAKNKKVKWKKVKGAKYYLVRIVKNGKTTYKRVNGTSVKAPKGAKVSVRPVKVKGGKVYAGVFKTKKVK